MTKSKAVALFGSASALARALEVTRGYIGNLPEGELSIALSDRIAGAAIRLGVTRQNGVESTTVADLLVLKDLTPRFTDRLRGAAMRAERIKQRRARGENTATAATAV